MSLSSYTLRPYQADGVVRALDFVANPDDLRRKLFSAPTGTGKSVVQASVQAQLGEGAWILTPSLEIIRGFLRIHGVDPAGMSATKLASTGAALRISTPTRFRNAAFEGSEMPSVIVADEVHHWIESNVVSGDLFALAPGAIWLGYTATPYRASPAATLQLHADWGAPCELLSIPDAIAGGYMALPRFSVVPLCDDDTISVQGGEFVVKAASACVGSRLAAIASLIDSLDTRSVPTCITVPGSEVARQLVERLRTPSFWIHQGTSAKDRSEAYEACRGGAGVLVSIRVLTEGVDLPWLRRLVDCRPTMSVVSWMQQLGRIMRPGEPRPEYIALCRNLERHAWVLQGAVPRSAVIEAQEAFPAPTSRRPGRPLGLEALGRLKPIDVPLLGGGVGSMYNVSSTNRATGQQTNYLVMLDPSDSDPLIASRVNVVRASGEIDWGKWRRAAMPSELTGFRTRPAKRLDRETGTRTDEASPKQRAWWQRAARRVGLDPDAAGDLKIQQFNALPALLETAQNMHARGSR